MYLTHEPVLSYLIYGTRFVFKPSGTAAGIAYMLLLTALTYALCHGLARLLERFAPGSTPWPRGRASAASAKAPLAFS